MLRPASTEFVQPIVRRSEGRSRRIPVGDRDVEAVDRKAGMPCLRCMKPPGSMRRTVPGCEILRHAQRGGMGRVYLARQQALKRLVCVKVLSIPDGEDADLCRSRFNREAELLASVSHPHILSIFDFGTTSDSGLPFLVTEYIEGGRPAPVHDSRASRCRSSQARAILLQVGEALTHLHSQGILHRDLKPENVLMPTDSLVKVGDLGIAVLQEEAGVLTKIRSRYGDVGYVSPEQQYALKVDERTDQYSLAALSYELLTGRRPLGVVPAPSRSNPRLSRELDAVDPPRTVGGAQGSVRQRPGFRGGARSSPAPARRGRARSGPWHWRPHRDPVRGRRAGMGPGTRIERAARIEISHARPTPRGDADESANPAPARRRGPERAPGESPPSAPRNSPGWSSCAPTRSGTGVAVPRARRARRSRRRTGWKPNARSATRSRPGPTRSGRGRVVRRARPARRSGRRTGGRPRPSSCRRPKRRCVAIRFPSLDPRRSRLPATRRWNTRSRIEARLMNPADRHLAFARSLFRESNDAFFLFDPETRVIVDLNPAALRMTGLEKDAACSLRLEDLFSGSDADGLDRAHPGPRTRPASSTREKDTSSAGRRRRTLPVNLSVSRIHTEPETVGLVVARDISERKRAEEALKQAETRYRSLVASTGVIVWEVDAGGVLLSISPGFEDDHRLVPGRLDRPAPRGAAPRPTIARRRAGMHRRAWQGRPLPRYELRIRTSSGDCLDCESLLVTRIREGTSERVLEVIRDITATEADRQGRGAGRGPAPGQGGRRTGQPGQERVPVQREP